MPALLPVAPVPFITLPSWVKAATACGFNLQPILHRLGVVTDLLHLEQATIDLPTLGLVMEECVAASRDVHFPFVLGENFAFDYLPDLGTYLATSASLREAVRVLEWVRELVNPLIAFRLEERDARAWLRLAPAPVTTPQDVYFVESIFAVVAKFGRLLTAEPVPFTEVAFRHPAPPHAAIYARYFGAPVRFAQPQSALELPRALLDRPLEGAFPQLNRQAALRVHRQLDARPHAAQATPEARLAAAVEAALQREPALLCADIETLAQRLHLHPRTLQRRLREEQASFAAIRDRVRRRMALAGLREPDQDLETLSERLGFSDRRAFTRAFTRWTGTSPSDFRRRQG